MKATIIFPFLFILTAVDSSISSFSKIGLSSEEDVNDVILKNFLNDFKRAYFDRNVPRHIIIAEGTTQDLRQCETLLKSFPYIICTNPRRCIHRNRNRYSSLTFVLIFINDISEKSHEKSVEILSRCKYCRVLYLYRGPIRKKSVDLLLTLTIEKYGVNSQFAHLKENVTKFYTTSATDECTLGSRLLFLWKPGEELNIFDKWPISLTDLNGCAVAISTVNSQPKMIIKEYENGSATITDGLEGRLILTIGEQLNFIVKTNQPLLSDRINYSEKLAVIHDLAIRKADIAIGRLRPTVGIFNITQFSLNFDEDCLTWGVPLNRRSASIIWVEFSWEIWSFVGLAFVAIYIVGITCHNMDSMLYGNRKKDFFDTFLNILTLHVGNPVIHIPRCLSGKFLLILTLTYIMILTTGYKSALASILTTDGGSQTIVDTEGILKANLEIGGDSYDLNFLKGQLGENETMSKLIERFIVMNDPQDAVKRLKSDDNFALLTQRSTLIYEKSKAILSNEELTFYIVQNCLYTYPVVMPFRNDSLLRTPINSLISRLSESGILNTWDIFGFQRQRLLIEDRGSWSYVFTSIREKYRQIFLIYVTCHIIHLLVFFMEIGTWHLKNKIH